MACSINCEYLENWEELSNGLCVCGRKYLSCCRSSREMGILRAFMCFMEKNC
jgi:hypothetical protein